MVVQNDDILLCTNVIWNVDYHCHYSIKCMHNRVLYSSALAFVLGWEKRTPSQGIEPWSPAWQAGILATILWRIGVCSDNFSHINIYNIYTTNIGLEIHISKISNHLLLKENYCHDRAIFSILYQFLQRVHWIWRRITWCFLLAPISLGSSLIFRLLIFLPPLFFLFFEPTWPVQATSHKLSSELRSKTRWQDPKSNI